MGVRRWQLQPVFDFGRMRESQEFLLSDADYIELGKFIYSAQSDGRGGQLKIRPADGVGYFSELDVDGPAWRGCSAGITTCGIMSDGKIKGCLSWPDDLVTGDLRTNDLWDIWFDPDAFSQTRRFSIADLRGNCYGCEKGELCKGGCSAISLSETGHFHADPYCFRSILNRNAMPAEKLSA
jgi:radical SAM protein with 4Fe4S-binding SPASM domain